MSIQTVSLIARTRARTLLPLLQAQTEPVALHHHKRRVQVRALGDGVDEPRVGAGAVHVVAQDQAAGADEMGIQFPGNLNPFAPQKPKEREMTIRAARAYLRDEEANLPGGEPWSPGCHPYRGRSQAH